VKRWQILSFFPLVCRVVKSGLSRGQTDSSSTADLL
jgi:hypothetical protein